MTNMFKDDFSHLGLELPGLHDGGEELTHADWNMHWQQLGDGAVVMVEGGEDI